MRKVIMRNILMACLVVGGIVGGASSALAHHSYSAFNMDKSITVNGIVKASGSVTVVSIAIVSGSVS